MKHKLLCCTAFMCGIFTFPFASALEYHYSADLYPNHFYAPTSSNRALDIDSADNSGGAAIVVPSAGMGTDADSTAPREGSPVIPVGSRHAGQVSGRPRHYNTSRSRRPESI